MLTLFRKVNNSMVRNLTCRVVLRRVTEMTCRRCVKAAGIVMHCSFAIAGLSKLNVLIFAYKRLKKHTSFHLLIQSLQYCSKISFIVETLTTLLFSTF